MSDAQGAYSGAGALSQGPLSSPLGAPQAGAGGLGQPSWASSQPVGEPVQQCGGPAGSSQRPEDEEVVSVRVSLFYDGTGNNRKNVESGASKSADDSYAAGKSNVALLEAAGVDWPGSGPNYHFTIYTEGIGTVTDGDDSNWGMGLGTGDTGVNSKVDSGIEQAVRIISSVAGKKSVSFIHVDTFGFSRGGAAARLCVWKCMQEKGKTLAERVKPLCKSLGEVKVKFVGLYDTVASSGVKHTNDTRELNLDAIKVAEKVVQLAAAEEHRKNFRLTNIKSAGGNGSQIFLPGVHSDVGGGYADTEDEVDYQLFDLDVPLLVGAPRRAIDRERAWLVNSGWYAQLEDTNFLNEVRATRRGIPNGYARIPLRLMAEFSRENGVYIDSTLEFFNPVPKDLLVAQDAINAYVAKKKSNGGSACGDWFKTDASLDPAWHKALRGRYLHFSARYGTTIGANEPEWSSDGPIFGHRMRKVQDG